MVPNLCWLKAEVEEGFLPEALISFYIRVLGIRVARGFLQPYSSGHMLSSGS